MEATKKFSFSNMNNNLKSSSSKSSAQKKSIPGPINPLNFFVMFLYKFAKKPLMLDINYRVGIYLCVVCVGSVYFDIFRMPQTYFSNRYNILNQLFAKWAWGWTVSLLFCFIVSSSYVYTGGDTSKIRRHVLRLFVGTICWYVCIGLFQTIENESGSCHLKQGPRLVADPSVANKRLCKQQSGAWFGFDISGHIFLLVLCNLFICEEVRVLKLWRGIERLIQRGDDARPACISVEQLAVMRRAYSGLNTNIKIITVVLSLLSVLWDIMIIVTVIYFHNMPSKLTAVLAAVVCWFVSYRYIFTTDVAILPTTPTKDIRDLSH